MDLFERILSTTDFLFAYLDRDFNFIWVNQAYAKQDGRDPDFYVGKNHFDLFPHADNQSIFRRVVETGASYTARAKPFEYAEHPERGVSYWDWTLHPVKNPVGQVEGLLLCLTDASERTRAVTALRESESRLRAIIESLPFDFFALDRSGRYVIQNAVCRENWGDVIGQRPADLLVDSETRALWESNNRRAFAGEVVTERVSFPVKGELRHFQNVIMPILSGREIVGIQGINIDLTENQLLQEKLVHSQKMEAIGTLAGGTAHDFNNMLTGILGHANMLRLQGATEDQLHHAVDAIENTANRARELIHKLLGFASKSELREVPVDLHQVVSETLSILERTFDKRIRIVVDYGARPATVKGDPAQLGVVMMNLAVNARDAMPDGGALVFETRTEEYDIDSPRLKEGMLPGVYVCVAVRDSGVGMPEEVRRRVFEPFFTTKEPGEGTGMGLAMVYGIVKSHRGGISVISEPGRGTSFEMCLPAHTPDSTAEAAEKKDSLVRGSGTVMVVDDEEIVLEVAGMMLEHLGYQPVLIGGAREAIAHYREHHQNIDLVILDLAMPVMNGRTCFKELKKINPDVRAILATGHGPDQSAGGLVKNGICDLIKKPFDAARLSQAVAEALA
jgi:PAS domain S-box-containing protein